MHFKKLASNAASLAVIAITLGAAGCATSTATKPVPREGGWLKRHEGFVVEAKQSGTNVLFLGDSITAGWRSKGKEIWQREFAPLKAINFGISGDRTQHVLWRLRNGETNGIKPKAVVLMIGTNNTGKEKDGSPRNTTAEIISGVRSVVKELRSDSLTRRSCCSPSSRAATRTPTSASRWPR